MRTQIAAFALMLTLPIWGQEVQITRGSEVRTLRPENVLTLHLLMADRPDTGDCLTPTIEGQLEGASADSLYIRWHFISAYGCGEAEHPPVLDWGEMKPVIPIAKRDIYSLSILKSEKHSRRQAKLGFLGGVLTISGLGTALNSLLVSDHSDSRALLVSGGIQFGTGLLVVALAVGKSRQYQFQDSPKPWHWK